MTPSIVAPRVAGRPRTISLLVALTPAWLLAVTALSSNVFAFVFTGPPELLGVPLGVMLETVALVWMLGGVAIVWRARTSLPEALGLLVFTIPATVVAVLTPPLIELLQTLR